MKRRHLLTAMTLAAFAAGDVVEAAAMVPDRDLDLTPGAIQEVSSTQFLEFTVTETQDDIHVGSIGGPSRYLAGPSELEVDVTVHGPTETKVGDRGGFNLPNGMQVRDATLVAKNWDCAVDGPITERQSWRGGELSQAAPEEPEEEPAGFESNRGTVSVSGETVGEVADWNCGGDLNLGVDVVVDPDPGPRFSCVVPWSGLGKAYADLAKDLDMDVTVEGSKLKLRPWRFES